MLVLRAKLTSRMIRWDHVEISTKGAKTHSGITKSARRPVKEFFCCF